MNSSNYSHVETPASTQPHRADVPYVVVLSIIHLMCLLVFVPWFFSWSGLALGIAGHFFFGMIGINVCYHRLLTHRGYECPKWLERTMALIGVCNLQDSPARWVAVHRMHHQHSDHQPDPHTPMVNLFWGHMGWLLVRNRSHESVLKFERYARDLLRDPFYMALERKFAWLAVYLGHALVFYVVGGIVGYVSTGTLWGAFQLACSWIVWGVVARTVFVLHGTWAVNSITHVWGYRNYETRDNSRNHWLVGLLAHGEGWHNNHHAQPRAAMHGHRWWEFDMSWWVIRSMEMVGLATNIVRPTDRKRYNPDDEMDGGVPNEPREQTAAAPAA